MANGLAILALELGTLLFFVFVVISLISWVLNQANAPKKVPPARRPNQPPVPRNERIQQEIDRFLRDAGGRPRQPVKADEIEIVERPPARRAPPPRKVVERPRPQPSQRTPAPASAPLSTKRPGEEAAARHLPPPPPPGTAASLASRGTTLTPRERLPHSVDRAVSAHLGAFAAAAAPPQGGQRVAGSLLSALRTPRGMRTAIIMHEILQRPRALRR